MYYKIILWNLTLDSKRQHIICITSLGDNTIIDMIKQHKWNTNDIVLYKMSKYDMVTDEDMCDVRNISWKFIQGNIKTLCEFLCEKMKITSKNTDFLELILSNLIKDNYEKVDSRDIENIGSLFS